MVSSRYQAFHGVFEFVFKHLHVVGYGFLFHLLFSTHPIAEILFLQLFAY